MLNTSTLLLVLIGFTVLTTLLLTVAALSDDALAEQRLWALGNVLVCLGLAVSNLTDLHDVVHGGIRYALMGLGLSIVLRGVRQFCNQTLAWHWVAAITMVCFLIPAYFSTLQPSQTARLIATGLLFGGINFACALTLLRGSHGSTRTTMWIAVSGFTAAGIALGLRSIYKLAGQLGVNQDVSSDTLVAMTIFVVALSQVTIAFGLIMLVASRFV